MNPIKSKPRQKIYLRLPKDLYVSLADNARDNVLVATVRTRPASVDDEMCELITVIEPDPDGGGSTISQYCRPLKCEKILDHYCQLQVWSDLDETGRQGWVDVPPGTQPDPNAALRCDCRPLGQPGGAGGKQAAPKPRASAG